ncbi:hypothetical protein O3P69_017007 [Scylla paramamosain]|uniref:Lysosome-associated membrane glycoprotein 5 n=1 Tax=Scylla paramamosain TaxID=85552 RepID=A0AAW0TWR0_SCYPA
MARFTVVFAALLLVSGSVIAESDFNGFDITDPSGDTTTTEDDTTTTTSTTTTTTTSSTTTTTPETTTTTTPETTTTTTPETTTTTTPETTTSTTPSTTTSTSSTTTAPPTTTTPAPKPTSRINYNVTENNVTCVKIAGEIFFNINYSRTDNTTVIGKVFVPSLGVDVSGSCNETDGSQWISFTWGKNVVQMNFDPADKDSWTFTDLTASLSMDDLDNATAAGKTLNLTVDYNFNPGEVSVNHSFICRADLSTSNVTAMLDKDHYNSAVTSTLKNIQIQAFNKIGKEKDFVDSVHCTADNISDVVPIAVGCALAGLVVIVLIAYLVGRRRRSGAYQSV